METKHYFPSEDLSEFVVYYWMVHLTDDSMQDEQSRISPSGYPELIFNLGKPVTIGFSNRASDKAPTSLIAGQITRSINVSFGSSRQFFCVKLKPYSLRALFNTDSSLFTDKYTDLDKITQGLYHNIHELLTSAPTDSDRIRIVEKMLRKLLQESSCRVSQHSKNFSSYLISNLYLPENAFVPEGNIRTFQRHIKKDVGLSPKMLQRIIRFNKAYHIKKNNPHLLLQDISYMCGYYDLSHLVNEFKEFSGLPPSCFFTMEDGVSPLFSGIF